MENTSSQTRLVSLVKAALIAALYIALTLINPLSYGAVQFRVSEMLNNLVVFNKRYIWALTLGCAVANINSSLGVVDMVFGTTETLLMTALSYWVSQHISSKVGKLVATVIICAAMSWIIALELFYVMHLPFWASYISVAAGELGAMAVGAILVYLISERIDLTK